MKIGFFDSGLGGLTVLKEVLKNDELNEEIYYLGDTKNTPYGTKEESFVKELIEDNINYLINIGCNPIVIACNTATSLSVKELREKYKDIVFIGTEPAVKVAADAHMNKRILVLATSITVRQEKLLNLVENLKIKDEVDLVPADKLVRFAESIDCNERGQEVEDYLKDILKEYDLKEYSHIVLGCTHFPLFVENFKNVINELCPQGEISIVDGAKGISKNLMNYINILKKEDEVVNKNVIKIVTTNKSKAFETRAKQILNEHNLVFEYKLQ
ncbi:MAG: glutamate racemase [Clostridia bacterium]|nr:glutamate racemase [Clostridia bacterium]